MNTENEKTIEQRLIFQSFAILKSFVNSPFMTIKDFTKLDRIITRV